MIEGTTALLRLDGLALPVARWRVRAGVVAWTRPPRQCRWRALRIEGRRVVIEAGGRVLFDSRG